MNKPASAGFAQRISTIGKACAQGGDPEVFRPFPATLEEDALKSRTGMRRALSQRAIGSQLIDNLNASIHLRALTDPFPIDESAASLG